MSDVTFSNNQVTLARCLQAFVSHEDVYEDLRDWHEDNMELELPKDPREIFAEDKREVTT